jgi:hypothetical protein
MVAADAAAFALGGVTPATGGAAKFVPHLPQNLDVSRFSALQLGQNMMPP